MNKTRFVRMLSWILCVVLIAAAALLTFGCDGKKDDGNGTEKHFTFIVKDKNGKEASFSLTSTRKYLGDALLDEGLIEGEEGQYGLYVKKVNGTVADADADGAWWKLIVDGKDAMVGVSSVELREGGVYRYEYTK